MITKWLTVGISTISVIVLILTSFTNVVGYQSVQSSHQQTIKETANQRELLFQTIVDIANNKEIQRIILKSQMNRGIFPTSEMPVLTKNQLKRMYFVGLILSKVVSKSRIQSIIEKYQFDNQQMQKEISAVIENDVILKVEIHELSDSDCGCDDAKTTEWNFPVICWVLIFLTYGFMGILLYLYLYFRIEIIFLFDIWANILGNIGLILNCDWTR